MLLTLSQIKAAQARIQPWIHCTPVATSRTWDDLTGSRSFFKCENLQRGGSFKIRGAMSRLSLLSEAERQRGVVAFSSGNHAQGVALAARELGIPATIVMPHDAPQAKRQATAGYGADIVSYDRRHEDREAIARGLAEGGQLVLVPPYDCLAVMAGQGSVALELFEQVGELDALLVPLGGGGLMSGMAVVARQLHPQIKLYGVEVEAGNDWYLSLRCGERVRIPLPTTLADGIRTTSPGELPFRVLRGLLDAVALVSEAEVVAAMRFLLLRMKLVVEPTGAVAAAALLAGKVKAPAQRVGVVISGGNVDPEVLGQVLA